MGIGGTATLSSAARVGDAARNAALEPVFITQVASRFNPLAVPADIGSQDCLIASALMSSWITGHGTRPSSPAAIRDAVTAARAVATGEIGSSRSIQLHEGQRLLTHLGVPSEPAAHLNDVLDSVRAGQPGIAIVDMKHVWVEPNDWTSRSYHARVDELGIDHLPGPHAIVVTDWHLPSETYGVLDPMAVNGPFRATATELAYSNVQWARTRHPNGIIVQPD